MTARRHTRYDDANRRSTGNFRHPERPLGETRDAGVVRV